MKILVQILSLYIIVLTVVPCIDTHDEYIAHKTDQLQNNQTHKDADSDHCSPFCTCQCCATPTVIQEYNDQFSNLTLLQILKPQYTSGYILLHHTRIWQPPKNA